MTISINDLLQHLNEEVYCKLGVSPVHGIGVFAIRTIEKGCFPLRTLVEHEDIDIEPEEIAKLPLALRELIDKFCYVDAKRVEIPSIGLNTMHISLYLNHAKEPNLAFNAEGELFATRRIRAGEELFIDYDISFGEKHDFTI